MKVRALVDARYSLNGYLVDSCPKGEERELSEADALRLIGHKLFEEVKPKAAPKKAVKPAKPKKETKPAEPVIEEKVEE